MTRAAICRTLGLVLLGIICGAGARAVGRGRSAQTEPQRVTLYARIKSGLDGFGRAAFNFKQGLRSDDARWIKQTGNVDHLVYGNESLDGETDWFSVSTSERSWDRIKDMGEIEWADLCCAPLLPTPPRVAREIKVPRRGETFEASSEQRVTEAVAGHMYALHVKRKDTDFYVMFRVERLERGDQCEISWKIMPSPE